MTWTIMPCNRIVRHSALSQCATCQVWWSIQGVDNMWQQKGVEPSIFCYLQYTSVKICRILHFLPFLQTKTIRRPDIYYWRLSWTKTILGEKNRNSFNHLTKKFNWLILLRWPRTPNCKCGKVFLWSYLFCDWRNPVAVFGLLALAG